MTGPQLSELFDSDGTIFMGSRREPAGCRVGLFGVPYDGTTSFRPGTRFGPAAIREVSTGPETWPASTWIWRISISPISVQLRFLGNPEPF